MTSTVDHLSYFPDVATELDQAAQLEKLGRWTEAALRLGRAFEAALYASARSRKLDLTDRTLGDIDRVVHQLRQRSNAILRHKTQESVRSLSESAKLLSEAIASLTASEDARKGTLRNVPRRPRALMEELKWLEPTDQLRRQLGRQQSSTEALLGVRNTAAHPDVNGRPREVTPSEYFEMRESLYEILIVLVLSDVGHRARARLASPNAIGPAS